MASQKQKIHYELAELKTQIQSVSKAQEHFLAIFDKIRSEIGEKVIQISSEIIARFEDETKPRKKIEENVTKIQQQLQSHIHRLLGCELQLQKHAEIIVNKPTESTDKDITIKPMEIIQDVKRKKNVVLHGFSIQKDQDVRQAVESFFSKALHIHPNITNVKTVKTFYTRSPPIIVTLATQEDKSNIFRNCHKLKNFRHKISITDDCNRFERELYKLLSEKVQGKAIQTTLKLQQKIAKRGGPTSFATSNVELAETQIVQKPVANTKQNVHPTNLKQTAKEAFSKLKEDPFTQTVIGRFANRIKVLNEGGTAFTGLIARMAHNRRSSSHKCTCRKPEQTATYANYISTKNMDATKVDEIFQRINKHRNFMSQRWSNLYCKDYCFCLIASFEELVLDSSYVNECYKNIKL